MATATFLALALPPTSHASETQIIERLLELPTHADSLAVSPEPAPPLGVEAEETASALALLGHWGEVRTEEEASPETRQRLLEAALEYPDRLPSVVAHLPKKPEAFDRVKVLYDTAPSQGWYSEYWPERVGAWLMLHSEHLRDELIEIASRAHDSEYGYVESTRELHALARLDWSAASPIIDRFSRDGGVRT